MAFVREEIHQVTTKKEKESKEKSDKVAIYYQASKVPGMEDLQRANTSCTFAARNPSS